MAKDMSRRSALAFLEAELRLGVTMSRIALQTRHAGKKNAIASTLARKAGGLYYLYQNILVLSPSPRRYVKLSGSSRLLLGMCGIGW